MLSTDHVGLRDPIWSAGEGGYPSDRAPDYVGICRHLSTGDFYARRCLGTGMPLKNACRLSTAS